MKLLIENRKWTLAIFFGLLMFFGTYLQGDAAVTPVSGRTPEVRDAIVATVPDIDAAADVTEAHLAAITTLNLKGKNIATLKADDFDGLTALSNLNLYGNQLSRLPDGLFEGVTALRTIRLGGNAIDPLPMPVALEKVAEGQFKAVAAIGATFDYVLSIAVINGSITGGATTVTIPQGRLESETFTVTRPPGTTGGVTVDIETFPRLPSEHYGYTLVTSDTAPLSVIAGINTAPVFIDGTSTTRSVAENTAAATNIGASITARDAENDTLTYTLSGAAASAFAIDAATGQLKTQAPLDYETQNVWTLTITVSDGSLTDTITVTITVTDSVENTAPSFYEGDSTTRVVFENTAVDTHIGTPVLATDATDDFLRYTLGGVHADAFAIDTATGQLKTKAPLDYETQRLYTVTITVDDAALSDMITVIISVMDVNDTVSSAGFVPVRERTPAVRDAIVAVVPNATDAASVTEADVAAIRTLNLRNSGISFLKTGDFSGMTALRNLNLYGNHLSSLPIGIFTGLPALTSLRLGGNVLDPLPLIVSLQSVGGGAFKAVMPTGAPFNIVLPIDIASGVRRVMIPQGSVESVPFRVVGTGTETPKVAFLGFPGLPVYHYGYTLAQSTVCQRTEQVAAAIAAAVGVEDCSTVTELDLATITSLDLSNAAITALQAGDFDGMLSLTRLSLDGNDLTHLPMGIFDDLVSLTALSLNANQLTTLPSGIFRNLTSLTHLYLQRNDLRSLSTGVFDGTPYLQSLLLSHNNLISLPAGIFEGLTELQQLDLRWNPDAGSQLPLVVALEKVGTNGFKAVVPSGAPFEIMLPLKVVNGTSVDGAAAIIIPTGSVESRTLTLTRTPNTIHAVTVAIETPLP
ncbi:MAG: cadherin domain-containing protein, partial [Candidatus Poribacteria bacterium]|nr:cadherin domain-containing protein [Candidatus Poribacteria bacterium]